jgi:hypothetical protein
VIVPVPAGGFNGPNRRLFIVMMRTAFVRDHKPYWDSSTESSGLNNSGQ